RHAPGDISCIYIDGGQQSPWWFLAGLQLRIPKSGIVTGRAGAPVRHGRTLLLFGHLSDSADFISIDEYVPKIRIEGYSGPRGAAQRSGKHDGGLHAKRRVT